VSQDVDKTVADPGAAETSASAAVEGPDHPELYVAAAFAGAFLFARVLKRIVE
jgi:hypothetical protein